MIGRIFEMFSQLFLLFLCRGILKQLSYSIAQSIQVWCDFEFCDIFRVTLSFITSGRSDQVFCFFRCWNYSLAYFRAVHSQNNDAPEIFLFYNIINRPQKGKKPRTFITCNTFVSPSFHRCFCLTINRYERKRISVITINWFSKRSCEFDGKYFCRHNINDLQKPQKLRRVERVSIQFLFPKNHVDSFPLLY